MLYVSGLVTLCVTQITISISLRLRLEAYIQLVELHWIIRILKTHPPLLAPQRSAGYVSRSGEFGFFCEKALRFARNRGSVQRVQIAQHPCSYNLQISSLGKIYLHVKKQIFAVDVVLQ
jgi:hypothetical protein